MSPRPDAPEGADPFENDDSIPLLTDVVAPGSGDAQVEAQAAAAIAALVPAAASTAEGAAAQLPEPQPHETPQPRETPQTAPAPAPAPPPPPAVAREPEPHEWAELAARIEHGVTSRMLEQAGPMLEASLQSMVSPLIEQAAVQIAQDLHDAFSHLVRDLVARALAEELALLQTRDAGSFPDDTPTGARDPATPTGAAGPSAFLRASPP